ncbi:hypothetical protein DPMN_166411 [Dreissena polymorpha]|uniref:Uncharacterized protein n=1 Tax=Dreissena polymorpha TaxID=45954 RepID=A0A9D4F1G0_DREPO|nr:hypothetical protein DPMN_166411 [Dreissena polymorpha]
MPNNANNLQYPSIRPGNLLHKTSVTLALCDVTSNFLMYGSHAEESSIFLWDNVTSSRIATFTLGEGVRTPPCVGQVNDNGVG